MDIVQKHYKHENSDRSSVEGSAVRPNFNAPDDGRVGRNM
jgi:hypothetical protein